MISLQKVVKMSVLCTLPFVLVLVPVLILCLEGLEGTGLEDLEVVGRESDQTEKLQRILFVKMKWVGNLALVFGFFARFPRGKKSAKVAAHRGSQLGAHSSSSMPGA